MVGKRGTEQQFVAAAVIHVHSFSCLLASVTSQITGRQRAFRCSLLTSRTIIIIIERESESSNSSITTKNRNNSRILNCFCSSNKYSQEALANKQQQTKSSLCCSFYIFECLKTTRIFNWVQLTSFLCANTEKTV